MNAKTYIDWLEVEYQWVVRKRGQIVARFDTKQEAKDFAVRNYPGEGYEEERVQVRENSPHGAKRGQ